MDWVLSVPDHEARDMHLQAERWMLDECPLAGPLFDDVIELLYHDDRFMRGTLTIGGRRAAPDLLNAPLVIVLDQHCSVAPPQSILPFLQVTTSVDRRLLWYQGDVGVGLRHLGMLIGRDAHRRLWPEILQRVRL
jgi:polyhydroxyalkanoate synthase